jgi:anti-sigma factor RsiW
MKDIEQEHVLIRRYLLGELDEELREQLEQRLISDSSYKQEVLITEGELLDEFVLGELSPEDRALFLRNFLASPAQRRKLETAKALHAYAANHKSPAQPGLEGGWLKGLVAFFRSRNRFMQFSWATVALLVLVGSAALIYSIISGQNPYHDELVALNQFSSPVLEAGPSVASAQLAPLLFRGSNEAKTIKVSRETTVVQLQLPTAAGAPAKYRVTLKENGGAEVFQLNDVATRQVGSNSMLVLQIPVKMLTATDYVVEVLENSASADSMTVYSFRIEPNQ